MRFVFGILLLQVGLFLILLVLVQRGRGGGLAGAFGGLGGQSAFGTKAGDTFTRVTMVVAAIWILLSMASVKILSQTESKLESIPGAGGAAPIGSQIDTAVPSGTDPGAGEGATGSGGGPAGAADPGGGSTSSIPGDRAEPAPPSNAGDP
jgi:preprotein translocase subunit SecG